MSVSQTADQWSDRQVGGPSEDLLADHDAVALAGLLAQNQVSAAELVDAAIARAEAVEGSINAIAASDFDRARSRARTDLDGALAGVPTFIKDMTPVAGLRTGCGSDSMAESAPATANAPIVDMFESFGMINLGKSSLPEYGLTCSTEFPDAPPTRNPWNLGHSVGGSSGGSSALVAAGVVPVAHAADGGGSIRIPAAACGLVGLKASRDRIIEAPTDNMMPVKIGASGVVTRSVRDTCAVMAAAEEFHHHPSLPLIGLVDRPLDRQLRIGFLTESPLDITVDEPTVAAVHDAAALAESLGHDVEEMEVPVPATFADDFLLYWAVLALAIQRGGRKVIHPDFDARGLTDFTNGLAGHAKRNPHKVPGAIRRLRQSGRLFNAGLGHRDVIISPTVSHLPPPIGFLGMEQSFETLIPRVLGWASFTALANATGAPGISLPLSHDATTNLPIGVHFGARLGQERLLLELALQLEAAKPFRQLR